MAQTASARCAVIGLGTMGLRAALRLKDAGHEVMGFDVADRARTAASEGGVRVMPSPEAASSAAEVTVMSLPMPKDVIATVEQIRPALGAGRLIADLSTIDPETARHAAALAAEPGGAYLDCPVLGRPDRIGSWTVLVGGPDAGAARLREIFEGSIGRAVVHCGPVGSASVLKLLNNLMFGAVNAITVEALAVCAAAGVDPGFFVETIANSGAAAVSGLFREMAPKIVRGDFSPDFSLDLLTKDNRLALGVAEDVGLPLIVGNSVQTLNRLAQARGHGREDTGAAIKVYEEMSGLPARTGASGARQAQ